jgi:hypothetical protein
MAGKKRFRIELEDAEGSKYNLSLEGNISKDKILKIVEFMDLLNIENEGSTSSTSISSIATTTDDNHNNKTHTRAPASVGDRIWALIDAKFPYGSFTSSDILELYEDTYNEPIKLSIISTYLSRYSERGRLIRNRQGKEWSYKTARQSSAAVSRAPEQQRFYPPPPVSYDQLQ